MPLISANWADALVPGARHWFTDAFTQDTSMIPLLYSMKTSSKAVEYDMEVGDIADFEEMDGSIPYDDMGQGYKTNYEHKEFARGIKVERKLVMDDQYNIINRRNQVLGLAAFRRRETDGSSLFNNAFNSGFTGGDGLCLCNSAHTSKNGGANQSNTGTTALSPAAVETARQTMIACKTNRDNNFSVKPDMLLVPHQLEETAYAIINSKGKVDSDNNNVNFHLGKYKLVVWNNYLTDANNWFLVDSRLMKLFLLWFDREDVQFFKDSDFDTLMAKFAGYMRYSFGWSDWRWIFGSNVS